MKKITLILLAAFSIMFVNQSIANNIELSNVTLENQNPALHYCNVQFDLSWENSWRTSSIPQNWDAAWVFIKFSVAGGEWQHATLNPANSNAGSGATMDFSPDNMGVFIYRNSDGSGTNTFNTNQIRWDYGIDGVNDDASVEVKVFAIEMIYVPSGNFFLGDGDASSTFFIRPTPPTLPDTDPYYVTNNTITVGTNAGNLAATGNVGNFMAGVTINPLYPTGYNAFYSMKYEISQAQYVDFLNNLTRIQQNERVDADVSGDGPSYTYVLTLSSIPLFNNGISCPPNGNGTTDPITFFCDLDTSNPENEIWDGMTTACNMITWMDLAAYADWAGLRPISEPEFEKACRGPNSSITHEYAWGNTSIFSDDYGVTNLGGADEFANNQWINPNIGHCLYASTSGAYEGPSRCGVFAADAPNHTRTETGASYYGIMQMSGNLFEATVSMLSVAGSSFTGLHGDGVLTSDGFANTDYWPGIDGNNDINTANTTYLTVGVTGAAGIGTRGAFFGHLPARAEISDRVNAISHSNLSTYSSGNGGRLVHTAP